MDDGWTTARRRRLALGLLATPLLALCFGCPFSLPNDDPNSGDQNPPDVDSGNHSSLNTASTLTLDENGGIEFDGSIAAASEIDIYAIGTLSAGDRLYVDVRTTSGALDPVAAIFDSRTYLVAFNDDRAPDASNLNPLLDIVVQGAVDTYYLGVIAYPGERKTGAYHVSLQVQRQYDTTPLAHRQIVFLDWDGGSNVTVPNVGMYNLPAFSAIDVGLPAAQTGLLKQRVQEIVEERYKAFDLRVLSSDDTAEPAEPHSTVYFGGAHYQAFAISEQIDTFNKSPSDKAIVFTQGFQGAFATNPTFEQMAQALGNTVAHEVGHLLGLVHTADCDDLMDTSCFNDRMLTEQEFSTAQLDDSVFPFGDQPATEILTWVLGVVGM